MLQAATTPLSAMDPATMRAVFNLLAAERGAPPAPKRADRFTLGKGIALLRATPKPKPVAVAPTVVKRTRRNNGNRPALIRQCALTELARIVCYRHKTTGEKLAPNFYEGGNYDDSEWLSVGAAYAEVAVAVRKKFPKSRISANVLRRFAHHVRVANELDAQGRPVTPALEGFRNVLLPEDRPQARRGVRSGTGKTNRGRPGADKREAKRKRDARASARLQNHSAKRRTAKRR